MGFLSSLFGSENKEKKKVVNYYRSLTNMLGLPEIEGIENISDDRIFEISNEVTGIVFAIAYDIAKDRGQLNVLNNSAIEMVCIALNGEINGAYDNNLEIVRQNVAVSWK